MNNGPYEGFESRQGAGRGERLLELLAIFFLFSVPNLIYLAAGYQSAIGEFTVLDFLADGR